MDHPNIAPWFEAGSGWYDRKVPLASPTAVAERAVAAYPCAMYAFALNGVWMPPRDFVGVEPFDGLLTCEPEDDGTWTAWMWTHDLTQSIQPMYRAELVAILDGVRVYKGVDWLPARSTFHEQSWICAPTVQAAKDAIQAMIQQEAEAMAALSAGGQPS